MKIRLYAALALLLIGSANAQIYNSPPAQVVTSSGGGTSGSVTISSGQIGYGIGTNAIGGGVGLTTDGAGDLSATGIVQASIFQGSGALLTGVVTSTLPYARLTAVPAPLISVSNSTGNLAMTSGGFTGTVTASTVSSTYSYGQYASFTTYAGNGSALTGITVSSVSYSAVTGIPPQITVISNSAGNIALTSLGATGTITASTVSATAVNGQFVSGTSVFGATVSGSNLNGGTISGSTLFSRIVSGTYNYSQFVSSTNSFTSGNVSVNGYVSAGTIQTSGTVKVSNTVYATSYVGSGALLTGIASGGVSPTYELVSSVSTTVSLPALPQGFCRGSITGGGGGGGGANGVAAAGTGGGGGSTAFIEFKASTGQSVSLTIGTGGGGGSAAGGDGALGGNTTLNVSGTTYTAGFGTSGIGSTATLANTATVGNVGSAGCSGPVMWCNLGGSGNTGLSLTNSLIGGRGGFSYFGDGAYAQVTANTALQGNVAQVSGGGGGGAVGLASVGGNGISGIGVIQCW